MMIVIPTCHDDDDGDDDDDNDDVAFVVWHNRRFVHFGRLSVWGETAYFLFCHLDWVRATSW